MTSGRPSEFSAETANKILEELCTGRTLREICRNDEALPAESTVRGWALDDREGFADRYHRAREIGYLSKFDEIQEIADDARNDWMDNQSDKGGPAFVLNGEHVQRSRLRVDTLKWVLAKALPKVFGDKLTLDGNLNYSHEQALKELDDADGEKNPATAQR